MNKVSNGQIAMPDAYSTMSKVEVESVEGGTSLSPSQAAKLRSTVAPDFFDRVKKLIDAIAPRKI